MITRQHILILIYGLAILVTLLAVLGAFQALALGLGQDLAFSALSWVAGAAGVLLCVDVLLLVAALGLRAIASESSGMDDRRTVDAGLRRNEEFEDEAE